MSPPTCPPPWGRLDLAARRVHLDALLERTPPWLEAVAVDDAGARFVDARSGEGWRYFPGGAFTLGLDGARTALVEAALALGAGTFDATLHAPPRVVALAPFFLGEQVLQQRGEPRWFGDRALAEAEAELSRRGARWPTEAEWESAWWQRPLAGFSFGDAELCADGWAATLSGHPGDGAALPGGPATVRAPSGDPREPAAVLPARRPLRNVRLFQVRPALTAP